MDTTTSTRATIALLAVSVTLALTTVLGASADLDAGGDTTVMEQFEAGKRSP